MKPIPTIKLEELEAWKKQQPSLKGKSVIVDHGPYGKARLDFYHKPPQELTLSDSIGTYNGRGDLIFYDEEGTKHTCFSTRNYIINKRWR